MRLYGEDTENVQKAGTVLKCISEEPVELATGGVMHGPTFSGPAGCGAGPGPGHASHQTTVSCLASCKGISGRP